MIDIYLIDKNCNAIWHFHPSKNKAPLEVNPMPTNYVIYKLKKKNLFDKGDSLILGYNPNSLEMVTVASSPRPENSSVEVETETQYLKIAKKGGGHKGAYCSWSLVKEIFQYSLELLSSLIFKQLMKSDFIYKM